MLLTVDIGNTQTTLGFYPATGRPWPDPAFPLWRMSTRREETADEYGAKILALLRGNGLDPSDVAGVAVASVVPPLDAVFGELSRKYFKHEALLVGPDVDTGVKILLDNPAEVGADRIVNAVAAFDRVKGPCIVADFGTAATFDCVNARGGYLGGIIAPGPAMAAEALARKTAKLPLVEEFRKPPSPLGKNTVHCMQAGLYYGYLGLTEEILRRLIQTMGGRPRVLATGGLASGIASATKLIQDVVPDLTLQGLRLVWERKQKGKSGRVVRWSSGQASKKTRCGRVVK